MPRLRLDRKLRANSQLFHPRCRRGLERFHHRTRVLSRRDRFQRTCLFSLRRRGGPHRSRCPLGGSKLLEILRIELFPKLAPI